MKIFSCGHNIYDDLRLLTPLFNMTFSLKVYRALCNTEWHSLVTHEITSVSWRHAGAIVAERYNELMSKNYDYMRFYCSGNEGTVSDDIRELFILLNWKIKTV